MMNRWKFVSGVLLFCIMLLPVTGFGRRATIETAITPANNSRLEAQPKTIGVKLAPVVKSVNPNKLRLQVGAKGSVVTVKGQALDKVTGVQLLQKNRPAKGLKGALQGKAKADSFKVFLSASKDARPGSYQLKILISGKAIKVLSAVFSVQVIAPKALKMTKTGKTKGSNEKKGRESVASKSKNNAFLTQVKSASPKKLNLTVGAASSVVTLKGSNLNRLTTVQVLRNNVVVRNVKASLQKSRNSMSRQLQLTAQDNTPAGNYTLRLLASGGQAVSLSERQLSIRVMPPGKVVSQFKSSKMELKAGMEFEKSTATLKTNTLVPKNNEIQSAILKSNSQKYKMLPSPPPPEGDVFLVEPIVPEGTVYYVPSGYVKFPPKGEVLFYHRGNGEGILKIIKGDLMLPQGFLYSRGTQLRYSCPAGLLTSVSYISDVSGGNLQNATGNYAGERTWSDDFDIFLMSHAAFEGLCSGTEIEKLSNFEVNIHLKYSCEDGDQISQHTDTVSYPLDITCDNRAAERPASKSFHQWEHSCPDGWWIEGEPAGTATKNFDQGPERNTMCVNI